MRHALLLGIVIASACAPETYSHETTTHWAAGLKAHLGSFIVTEPTDLTSVCADVDEPVTLTMVAQDLMALRTWNMGSTDLEPGRCLTPKSLDVGQQHLQEWVMYHVMVFGDVPAEEPVIVRVETDCEDCVEFTPAP